MALRGIIIGEIGIPSMKEAKVRIGSASVVGYLPFLAVIEFARFVGYFLGDLHTGFSEAEDRFNSVITCKGMTLLLESTMEGAINILAVCAIIKKKVRAENGEILLQEIADTGIVRVSLPEIGV